MIKDNIKNAKSYYNLSERVKLGLKYLEDTYFDEVENGKHEILGDEVFAIIQGYISKPITEGKFEVHKKYIDIQYIIDGEEKIGVGDKKDFFENTKYDDEKDIMFLIPKQDVSIEFINIKEKEFAIFTPNDAHMPSIAIENSSSVKKAVVKVLV